MSREKILKKFSYCIAHGCGFAVRNKGLGAYTKQVRPSKHISASKSEAVPLSVS